MEIKEKNIPKIIFIIPYRDRKYHMNIFRVMMKHVMEDYDEGYYEFCFAHQNDTRPFNRGAMKNLGFYAMKQKYPNDYKNITFVFNDVDTVPSMKGLINYETIPGIVKHFYGFPYALGGIFSITGADFENINGFPCYWSWGYEDNVINERVKNAGLTIDRAVFYKVGNQAILQTVDSFVKNVNKKHRDAMRNDNLLDGINTINNINYNCEDDFINIKTFEPRNRIENEQLSPYNMLENKFINDNKKTDLFDNIKTLSKPYHMNGLNMNYKQQEKNIQKQHEIQQRNNDININMNMSRDKFIRRGGLNFIKK